MKRVLILLLVFVAIVMIYLGAKSRIQPPIITGIGFIIIAALFLIKKENN